MKYLLAILICLSLYSCRRKGDASGRVFNIFTGKPIDGIGVNIDDYKIRAVSDKKVTRPIASTSTNSDGEYFFNYSARLGMNHSNRMIYLDKNLFSDMDTAAEQDIKYDFGDYPGCETVKWDYNGHSRKNQDFYLAPFSRIKVIPHNVTHMYDGLTVRIYLVDENYSKLAGYYYHGNGLANSNFYTQFPSNGKVYVHAIIEDIIYQNFYDSITVAPFYKTTFHFNY